MLGRPRENPDAAADQVITFRVTAAEAAALDRRLDGKNNELRRLGFTRRLLTRAAYVRNLLVLDLEAAGLVPSSLQPEASEQAPDTKQASTPSPPARDYPPGKSPAARWIHGDPLGVENAPARGAKKKKKVSKAKRQKAGRHA